MENQNFQTMCVDPRQIELLLQQLIRQQIPTTPFRQYANRYLHTYCQGRVKDNSYYGCYWEPVQLHLIPWFGDKPLTEIMPIDVSDYFKEKGKSLAIETLKKHRVCLNGIFETAIDNGLCVRNPVTNNLKLSSKIPPREKHAWNAEQYATAYQYALSTGHIDILTLLETAISRSEMLGLEWADHDPDKRVLHINNGLVQLKNSETERVELVHDGLKNNYRHRDIPLSPLLSNLISSLPHVIYVGGDRRKHTPPRRVETIFIFSAPHGGPYCPSNWYHRRFVPFMRALHEEHPDVPELTPHELRHSRASVLLEQGTEVFYVSKLLGHSKNSKTTNIYLHSDTEQLRRGLGLDKAAFPYTGTPG